MNKVGIGIITCNREKLFRECAASVRGNFTIVVVNDGSPYSRSSYPENISAVIQHKRNKGVGRSKNDALRYLMQQNCEHLFLIEDDIRIKDTAVIEHYINSSDRTGIAHFNYGYHGPANKSAEGRPAPRKIIEFHGVSIALNRHIVGAFSYYRRSLLDKVGLIDPVYFNTLEHVDHTLKIIKAGYHPPFWWFADLSNSSDFLEDLDPDLSNSVNRKNGFSFRLRGKIFPYYFKMKNGSFPSLIPDSAENEVMEKMEAIYRNNINFIHP